MDVYAQCFSKAVAALLLHILMSCHVSLLCKCFSHLDNDLCGQVLYCLKPLDIHWMILATDFSHTFKGGFFAVWLNSRRMTKVLCWTAFAWQIEFYVMSQVRYCTCNSFLIHVIRLSWTDEQMTEKVICVCLCKVKIERNLLAHGNGDCSLSPLLWRSSAQWQLALMNISVWTVKHERYKEGAECSQWGYICKT